MAKFVCVIFTDDCVLDVKDIQEIQATTKSLTIGDAVKASFKTQQLDDAGLEVTRDEFFDAICLTTNLAKAAARSSKLQLEKSCPLAGRTIEAVLAAAEERALLGGKRGTSSKMRKALADLQPVNGATKKKTAVTEEKQKKLARVEAEIQLAKKMAVSLSNQSQSPTSQPHQTQTTQTQKPQTPTRQPQTPTTQPQTPTMQPQTTQPQTPTMHMMQPQSHTPTRQPQTPTTQPQTPTMQPQTTQPQTPTMHMMQPQSHTPTRQPQTPTTLPRAPTMQTTTMHMMQPQSHTPTRQPQTPTTLPRTPTMQTTTMHMMQPQSHTQTMQPPHRSQPASPQFHSPTSYPASSGSTFSELIPPHDTQYLQSAPSQSVFQHQYHSHAHETLSEAVGGSLLMALEDAHEPLPCLSCNSLRRENERLHHLLSAAEARSAVLEKDLADMTRQPGTSSRSLQSHPSDANGYRPSRGMIIETSNYVILKDGQTIPEGYQLLAVGTCVVVPVTWLSATLAKLQGKDAGYKIKKVMEGMVAPGEAEKLTFNSMKKHATLGPVFQALELFAINHLKLTGTRLTKAFNTKSGTLRRAAKKDQER